MAGRRRRRIVTEIGDGPQPFLQEDMKLGGIGTRL